MNIQFLNTHTLDFCNSDNISNYETITLAFDVQDLSTISLNEYKQILNSIDIRIQNTPINHKNVFFNIILNQCAPEDFVAYSEYIMSLLIKRIIIYDKILSKKIYINNRHSNLKWNDIFLLRKFDKIVDTIAIKCSCNNMVNVLEEIK